MRCYSSRSESSRLRRFDGHAPISGVFITFQSILVDSMSMSESNTPADAEEVDMENIPKSFYILFIWLAIVTIGGLIMIFVPDLFRELANVFL